MPIANLPNVRTMYTPDEGFLIGDVDLDRADLQVVVWEADDADLKRRLRAGVDLHLINGMEIENVSPPPEDELIPTHPEYVEHKRRFAKQRRFAKAFVHGTNYGGSARTMAANCGISTKQSELAQARWFGAHPGIREWHERTLQSLMTTRSVTNPFGFRRFFFDRIEGCLPEALAWVPQSTVANVINIGWANLFDNLPLVQVLMQVHDSLVFQFHSKHDPQIRPSIRDELLIEIPYDDPLVIPVGLKLSDSSWGECKEVPWEPTA